jgi:CHASE3 domain sensor protein
MQTRLEYCSRYLLEVKQKMSQLLNSIHDPQDRAKVIEAVSLIEDARRAVSKTQEVVKALKHSAAHKAVSAGQSAI